MIRGLDSLTVYEAECEAKEATKRAKALWDEANAAFDRYEYAKVKAEALCDISDALKRKAVANK